jgi:tousled-like kinase
VAALHAQEAAQDAQSSKHTQQAQEMSRQAEEMRTLRRVNESLQASERSARAEAEKLVKEVQQLQPRLERARDAMRTMLVEASRREKLEKEEQLQRDCHEIGNVVAQRISHTVSEVWEEGAAFRSLDMRRKQAAEARKNVEEKKRQVTAQRKKASNALKVAAAKSESNAQPMAPPAAPVFSEHAVHDFGEDVEICTMRLKECKDLEAALDAEEEQLERRKRLHIRELKRQRDERQSQFCNAKLGNDDQYLLLNLLGKGGFSEVFRAFDLVNCQYVACKIHQLHPMWGEEKKANYIKHATREYNIQRTLNHPRLVGLLDVFEIDVNSFCTVLEYAEGTDLDQILKDQKMLSEKHARSIVSQVFSGLRYLNEQKPAIIHYDLKPANILYSDGAVKITDFGLSKLVEDSDGHDSIELTSQGAGTYWYLPPECFATGTAYHVVPFSESVRIPVRPTLKIPAVLCDRGVNAAEDFVQGRRLVCRCDFLPGASLSLSFSLRLCVSVCVCLALCPSLCLSLGNSVWVARCSMARSPSARSSRRT